VNVTPKTVIVNDTVDVTVRITGDGYKMVQNPITVVLDLDTTSSMNAQAAGDKANQGGNGLDRFANMKIASKYFVGTMKSSDQLGLVTYGYFGNNQYWQLINNVSYNHNAINTSIDNLTAQGGLTVSIKDSIDGAVSRITSNPNRPANEVGAIITLGDSSYNSGELAPIVLETWTQNQIRVYTIQYVSSNNGCNTGDSKVAEMAVLANQTHGIPFCCTNSSQVLKAMEDIKDDLSKIAGVNTTMDLDFENVTYVNNGTTMFGNDTVSYVAVGPFVNNTKNNVDPAGRTSIIWTDGNQSVVNQTDDWNDDFHLNFDIGTIHIKETWETTFRLRANKEGVIDLFGPYSTISYNGGTGNLKLPATYIIVTNSTIPQGLQSGLLSVTDLVPQSGNFTDSVPMQWNLNYTAVSNDTVTETYWYSFKNQPFIEFGSSPPMGSTNGLKVPRNFILDVSNFPQGDYRIKVIATVSGIPPAEDSGAFTKLSADNPAYIWLK